MILEKGNLQLMKAIVECIENVLKGNITLKEPCFKKLLIKWRHFGEPIIRSIMILIGKTLYKLMPITSQKTKYIFGGQNPSTRILPDIRTSRPLAAECILTLRVEDCHSSHFKALKDWLSENL